MAENGGFDLSAILQNEETVQQLRQMAGSMGLSDKLEEVLSQQQTSGAASSAPRQVPSPPPSPPETGGLGKNGEPPGQLPLSPQMIAAVAKIAQAMNQEGPETRFLQSLGPLLKPERRPKVEEAVQILRMVQAFQSVEGAGGLGALLGGLTGHH